MNCQWYPDNIYQQISHNQIDQEPEIFCTNLHQELDLKIILFQMMKVISSVTLRITHLPVTEMNPKAWPSYEHNEKDGVK